MKQSNVMKTAILGIFMLIFSSLSQTSFAAAAIVKNQTIKETQNVNWLENAKRHLHTFQKVATKKVRQFKKQYREKSSIEKVGWGIGMILVGVLVTLGSILTLSGWWFVIGLGLIIFGAIKIVFGVLGVVF